MSWVTQTLMSISQDKEYMATVMLTPETGTRCSIHGKEWKEDERERKASVSGKLL